MKRIFLYLALIVLAASSCKKDEPKIPEIEIGGKLTEIILDKETTQDVALSGGNGKFQASVRDSRILEARIDGSYLKLKGLEYGETIVLIRSHNKQKTLTVKVQRSELNLPETSVTLYPGQERQDIRVIGGGDDVVVEEEDLEEAVTFEWEAKTGSLKLRGTHEGEAKLIFKTQDNRPAKELVIKVKADNDVSDKVGLYSTNRKELKVNFPVLMHAYRAGKMAWISSSPSLQLDQKRVVVPAVISPEKGKRIETDLTFVNVSGYTTGKYSLLIEEVRTDKKLVTLRGKGMKLVVPYGN